MEETNKFQHVIIKFSDGTTAWFTGPAVAFDGDTRTIIDIRFTPPDTLPEEYYFERIAPTGGAGADRPKGTCTAAITPQELEKGSDKRVTQSTL